MKHRRDGPAYSGPPGPQESEPNTRGCNKRGCKSNECGKKQRWPDLREVGRTRAKFAGFARNSLVIQGGVSPLCLPSLRDICRICANFAEFAGKKRGRKSIVVCKHCANLHEIYGPLCYGTLCSYHARIWDGFEVDLGGFGG